MGFQINEYFGGYEDFVDIFRGSSQSWAIFMGQFYVLVLFSYRMGIFLGVAKIGTCIKGLFWPPLEPETESCFSPISSYWFIRRIAQVNKSGIYFTFTGCYGYQNGRQNRLKIEKLPH